MRKCSYDPRKHLVPSIDETTGQCLVDTSTGEIKYTLTTQQRMVWFHTWCEENSTSGFIDDSEIRFERVNAKEIGTLCIATAAVFINDRLAGKASSSVPFRGTAADKYIVATATTYAKGRALANAGFGFLENGEAEKECTTEQTGKRKKNKTKDPNAAETKKENDPYDGAMFCMLSPDLIQIDQAEQVVWPTNAEHLHGRTLGELCRTPEGCSAISKVAKQLGQKYEMKYPELVDACRILAQTHDL